MAKNALREMTGHRRVKLGHIVAEFATPGIGHILKSAGCDYVFFDMEHSGFSMETVKSAIRYFEAADLPVLLRAPSQDYHFIARAMDMGVEAFMAPMVSTVEQGIDHYAQGFDFVCYSGDVWVLHDAVADAVAKIRAGCE